MHVKSFYTILCTQISSNVLIYFNDYTCNDYRKIICAVLNGGRKQVFNRVKAENNLFAEAILLNMIASTQVEKLIYFSMSSLNILILN